MAARRVLGLQRVAAARLAAEQADAELPEELERRLRRQEKAIRLRRMQRLMEPPGPPERTLSRQAMEQIRYLSQEFPEDWPVSRLAQGFQVTPDVVCRVLRSRFSPSWERSLKQDGQVWAGQSGRPPTGHGSQQPPALLTRESTLKLLPASSKRAGSPRHAAPKACVAPLDSPAPEAVPQKRTGEGQDVPCDASPGSDAQAEEGYRQGRFLSKEELEQLAAEGWESNLRMVQRGLEFFDESGNFLYRIPAPPRD
ncbi:hypothetical protein lerEdw1_011044 [Lerista edwardsae]|nr:hypothetical protein lerEdw1_011044 [Lerista edwardsae]